VRRALVVLAVLAGCSEGTGSAPPDAAPDAAAPDAAAPDAAAPDAAADSASDPAVETAPGPAPAVVFSIQVTEGRSSSPQGEPAAWASIANPPYGGEMPAEEVLRAGDCVFLRAVWDQLCDPPCTWPQYCEVDTCVGRPPRLSGGKVVVTGLKTGLTLEETTEYHYYAATFDPEPTAGDVFDEGTVVTATAEGADLPSFSVRTRGVAEMSSGLGCDAKLEAGKPVVVTWQAGTQGDRVFFSIRSPNHGTQFSRIECETADDGELVVDASLVDLYVPDFHPAGDGWVLTRTSTGFVDLPQGRVELVAAGTTGCRFVM